MTNVVRGTDFKAKAEKPQPDPFELLDPNAVIRKVLFGEMDQTIDTAPSEMPPESA